MENLRNWIEKAFGKRIIWCPVCVGYKGGRALYEVDFEDGTTADCFIDFIEKTIEKY